jgi:hypothetical protein
MNGRFEMGFSEPARVERRVCGIFVLNGFRVKNERCITVWIGSRAQREINRRLKVEPAFSITGDPRWAKVSIAKNTPQGAFVIRSVNQRKFYGPGDACAFVRIIALLVFLIDGGRDFLYVKG